MTILITRGTMVDDRGNELQYTALKGEGMNLEQLADLIHGLDQDPSEEPPKGPTSSWQVLCGAVDCHATATVSQPRRRARSAPGAGGLLVGEAAPDGRSPLRVD
jgi:hypothetical protein